MTYKIIDDFLPQEEFDLLEDHMMGYYFPWYYMDRESYETETDTFQFQHTFYRGGEYPYNSEYYDLVKPILRKLKVDEKKLHRIKAILTTKTPTHRFSGYHIDYENMTTVAFYVNSNNGYTEFQKGGKIESVANRAAIFDSNMVHGGHTATDQKTRVLINFNYEI
tara:strand:- start:217 stop:711 length:495 start_codon:yes stop_codon:yes gene_type:complete